MAGPFQPNQRPTMDVPPVLPIPPGQSPFQAKGVLLDGVVQYVERVIPGGLNAVLERVSDPRLKDFYRQRFLAASWYDYLPFLHFAAAVSAVTKIPTGKFVADHAIWQMERDVRGTHRLLLFMPSPEAIAERLGVAWGRYFNFATVEVVRVEPGACDIAVRGLPGVLMPWYRASVNAGAERLLHLAGARQIASTYTVPEAAGSQEGIPLVSFTVHRTWTR